MVLPCNCVSLSGLAGMSLCRSKRLQQAVKGISKAPNPDMMEDFTADTPKPAGKRSKKGEPDGLTTTPGTFYCFSLVPRH